MKFLIKCSIFIVLIINVNSKSFSQIQVSLPDTVIQPGFAFTMPVYSATLFVVWPKNKALACNRVPAGSVKTKLVAAGPGLPLLPPSV